MTTRYAVDSSVIVAALLGWHEMHGTALAMLERALCSRPPAVVPAHALVEAYAVMTRLPSPHRVAPPVALEILRTTFGDGCRIAQLDGRDLWPWLERAVASGVAGGRTYDALVAEAARLAGATHMMTLNPRDFEAIGPGMEIVGR